MAEGSIIAAIIVTQMPRNQPGEPSSVPGPASIPRMRTIDERPRHERDTDESRDDPGTKRPLGERGLVKLISIEYPRFAGAWTSASTSLRTNGAAASTRGRPADPRTSLRDRELPNMELSCGSQ